MLGTKSIRNYNNALFASLMAFLKIINIEKEVFNTNHTIKIFEKGYNPYPSSLFKYCNRNTRTVAD